MKKVILVLVIGLISSMSFAQNDVDALRYSTIQVGGTARSIAYSGAVGALGADFSSLTVNPAGIGLYRNSELSISPVLYYSNSRATMNGFSNNGGKDNFNINQFGLVLNNNSGNINGWKSFQFAIGLNRLNNFNHYFHISNENKNNSLMNAYQLQAYGKYPNDLDPFSTNLAWYNYLLQDTVRTSSGVLAYTSPLANGGVQQDLRKTTWGSMNEMNITFGSSYNDIFYIGGGVSFPFVRYYEQSEYTESDIADTIPNFSKFVLNNTLETHGSGVNFKLGFIVRPTGYLRLGIAFHSPTWLYLNDAYNAKISRYNDNGAKDAKSSPDGKYDYSITTPMKVVGSATLTLAQFILLSADIDYLNYSNMRLGGGRNYSFISENSTIRDKYSSTLNIRAGAEIRLNPVSLRAGFARYGNPYSNGSGNGESWIASGGIGYRLNAMFLDFAASYSVKNSEYYLYDARIINPANLHTGDYRFVITAGYKF